MEFINYLVRGTSVCLNTKSLSIEMQTGTAGCTQLGKILLSYEESGVNGK
jgi:hypothetical protein